jgi:hypothetical protein
MLPDLCIGCKIHLAGKFAGEPSGVEQAMGFVSTEHWTRTDAGHGAARAGLRIGNKGTHTSRTIMLAELSELLASIPLAAAVGTTNWPSSRIK